MDLTLSSIEKSTVPIAYCTFPICRISWLVTWKGSFWGIFVGQCFRSVENPITSPNPPKISFFCIQTKQWTLTPSVITQRRTRNFFIHNWRPFYSKNQSRFLRTLLKEKSTHHKTKKKKVYWNFFHHIISVQK